MGIAVPVAIAWLFGRYSKKQFAIQGWDKCFKVLIIPPDDDNTVPSQDDLDQGAAGRCREKVDRTIRGRWASSSSSLHTRSPFALVALKD